MLGIGILTSLDSPISVIIKKVTPQQSCQDVFQILIILIHSSGFEMNLCHVIGNKTTEFQYAKIVHLYRKFLGNTIKCHIDIYCFVLAEHQYPSNNETNRRNPSTDSMELFSMVLNSHK